MSNDSCGFPVARTAYLFGCLAVLAGITTPTTVVAQVTHAYPAETTNAIKRSCIEGTGNQAFCDCAVDALQQHLPPKYVRITEDGYEVIEGAPIQLTEQVDQAALACRDQHVDLNQATEKL